MGQGSSFPQILHGFAWVPVGPYGSPWVMGARCQQNGAKGGSRWSLRGTIGDHHADVMTFNSKNMKDTGIWYYDIIWDIILWDIQWYFYIFLWDIQWYGYGSIPIHTIFRGMNIHLPAILRFTRGTRSWPIPILFGFSPKKWTWLCTTWPQVNLLFAIGMRTSRN